MEDRHFFFRLCQRFHYGELRTLIKTKSDTSGLLESCLQLFPFPLFQFILFFSLYMVQEVGLQMRCATDLDAA